MNYNKRVNMDDEIATPLVTQLSWTNNLLIISGSKTKEERHFYLKLTIKNNYSKREKVKFDKYEKYGIILRGVLFMDYLSTLMQERGNIAKKIDKYLEIDDFQFDINYLMTIHKYLFKGVIPFAGNFRECNLTRKEKVLNNESLIYADYKRIYLCLEYDFDNEKKKNYKGISNEELVMNIADFTLRIWQAHPFRDGNTRTVSVFIQKYLKNMGYVIDNSIFKENGVYFRNALILAGYYNYELGVHRNMEYIIKFYRKLLIDKTIELDSEEIYVKELFYRNSNHKKVLTK